MIRLILHIILSYIIVSVLFGCSKEDGNTDEPSDDYINLSSRIAVSDEQLSEESFVSGESIGLFVVPYNDETPGTIGTDDYVTNQELVFTGSAWELPDGERLPWPQNNTIDLYAYYPYDEDVSNPRSYTFAVRPDQSTREGYDASDFLLAITADITPRTSIPMIFYHKLSRININIDAAVADDPSETDVEVGILEMLPITTIDMANGNTVVNTGVGRITISPLAMESRDEEYSHAFSAIVPSQTINSGTRLLRISIDGTNYFYRTTEEITLNQGSTLTFNIAVTQLGISVSVEQINGWMEGGTVEGNVGGSAPRVLDLSEIDWAKSLVYDVYYRNSLIGEVCREYLFRNGGDINAQAVVVYPRNTDGTTNLLNGFVAQVMNRDRNTSTNLYEPNPASVHGGQVSFGTTNNLVSYNAGTSPLVELVRIVSSEEITAAAENSVVILEVKPRYMTDVDGNNYPIVKIGTQYWIAENAKMEHYRDGSDLQVFWWNDNISNKNLYGGYYIFTTIIDPRGIAPEGWRVPTGDDWTTLANYLMPNAGGKLKSNTLWSNLSYGDNVTGFSGLPAGRRTDTGVFNEFGNYGQWWSQTSESANNAYRLYLDFGNYAMHYTVLNKIYTQNLRLIRE